MTTVLLVAVLLAAFLGIYLAARPRPRPGRRPLHSSRTITLFNHGAVIICRWCGEAVVADDGKPIRMSEAMQLATLWEHTCDEKDPT